MEIVRHKLYENKKFQPGDILNTFISILDEIGVPKSAIRLSGSFRYGDGGTVRKEISFPELELICNFNGETNSISLSYPTDIKRDYNKDNSIILSSFQGGILLNVSTTTSSSIQSIMDKLEGQLKLEEMSERQYPKTIDANLEARVETLENKILELSKSPSCFLSYRFHVRGKALALELSRFLSLLNIKVVSGLGYEPRRVTEKVLNRLKSGHDFFVYLITKDGESTWTRDELAVAFGEGVPVIILVECGAEIGKGLLGDWEYIEFDGDHIGDTFIAILEALDYMKDQKVRGFGQQLGAPDA